MANLRWRGIMFIIALVAAVITVVTINKLFLSANSPCGNVVYGNLSLDDLSDAEQAVIGELVAGNNRFAFDMYQAMRSEGDNLIFSPFSISQAMAMAYAGARGETEQQIANALHFAPPQDALHPAFHNLHQIVTTQTDRESRDERPLQLSIANALWGQTGFGFYDSYLSVIAENYNAGLTPLDFGSAPEEARQRINSWVSDSTNGRIQESIPQDGIRADTRLVLTNAICFYGTWLREFETSETRNEVFYLLNGSEIMVPMMRHMEAETFRYTQGSGYQAIELPYEGGQAAMIVLVPDRGLFWGLEDALGVDLFASVLGSLHLGEVNLRMPRFEFNTNFNLTDTLAARMPAVFSGQTANFSGIADISNDNNLYFSEIRQSAFIKVDESGTEAVAATFFGSILTGLDTTFTIDRPFVYIIYDQQTDAILFLGRVLDPRV